MKMNMVPSTAVRIASVRLLKNASVWFGATLRGVVRGRSR